MKRSGRVRIDVAVFAALLLSASHASAQRVEESGGSGFEILGAVGLLTPIANLVDDPDAFGATVNVNVAYGVDATYWTSDKWGIGVAGWYSPAQLQVLGSEFSGAVPDDLGTADYLSGTVQAIYRFRGEGSRSPLEPYLALGGGVRQLWVDEIAAPQVVDSTDPMGTIAGGIRLDSVLGDMMVRLEIRDNVSFYKSPATDESRLQNDMILSFGLGVRFQ